MTYVINLYSSNDPRSGDVMQSVETDKFPKASTFPSDQPDRKLTINRKNPWQAFLAGTAIFLILVIIWAALSTFLFDSQPIAEAAPPSVGYQVAASA